VTGPLAVALLVLLACINLAASIVFTVRRDGPWALAYLGGFLILVGNIWAIVRQTQPS
jgi:hypothetical protein